MSVKERNLLKGAIRRVFSRSDLRREIIQAARISNYFDPNRPRVTKWSKCAICSNPTPEYLAEVDHLNPIIPVNKSLEDLSWDDIIDNVWCEKTELQTTCKVCHRQKSKLENKERAFYRKKRKKENGISSKE